MNILVTGANGQLGTHLRLLVERADVLHRYLFTDIDQLDITNVEAVRAYVRNNNIEAVLNCAAYTNVDIAEVEPDKATLVNDTAVGNLAEAMNEVGGGLIHVSTDYVFGGDEYNTPCAENLPVNPTGMYGRTKAMGEIAAQKCRNIIVRTAWLYSEYGKNFLLTMLNLTATHKELKVVFDQVGTPTYAGDLAKALLVMVEKHDLWQRQGVYHYSNEGVCSWFDFAKAIASAAGNEQCRIEPCRSSEFPSPVHRPHYSVLDKTKIKQTFGVEVPYWHDSMLRCIYNIKYRQ